MASILSTCSQDSYVKHHALIKLILESLRTFLSSKHVKFSFFTYLCFSFYSSLFLSPTKMGIIEIKDVCHKNELENKEKHKGEIENCHFIYDYGQCVCMLGWDSNKGL